MERLVLEFRAEHYDWCGRKISRALRNAGHTGAPSASTVTEILRRHGKLGPEAGVPRDHVRFEREQPNELWQMDFKGHFAMHGARCHPLTVVDDCSRYNLVLKACPSEVGLGVKSHLESAFRLYGLPLAMLCDNGPPWGGPSGLTELAIWLMRLGICVKHGRPYHPQTQGKEERFHKSLKNELIAKRTFRDLEDCQVAFDKWRADYNHTRPHDSLGLSRPADIYTVSSRAFPEQLPAIEYDDLDEVRKVQAYGVVHFKGLEFHVPPGLRGYSVGLRPTEQDGVYEIRFGAHVLSKVNLRQNVRQQPNL
jgi:transposase InsO family protein